MIHERLTAQNLGVWRSALVALCLTLAIPGLAQSGRGTLTGSVKDTTGANIPGASLVLTRQILAVSIKPQQVARACTPSPSYSPGLIALR